MTSPAAFGFLELTAKKGKPRTSGRTIVSDCGMPDQKTRNLLEVVGDCIDVAKLNDHAGLITRYSADRIKKRIALYHDHHVKVYPGGIPFEIAVVQGKSLQYLEAVAALGFDGVEISEDVIGDMEQDQREICIEQALELGLSVKTELGRKFISDRPSFDVDELVTMAKRDLALGVDSVVLEQAEIRLMVDRPNMIHDLVEALGLDRISFEAGGSDFPEVAIWLIKTLGPEVSLENIQTDNHMRVITIEACRYGLHRAIGHALLASPSEWQKIIARQWKDVAQ